MVDFRLMTNVDRILAEAKNLNDGERWELAERFVELVPPRDSDVDAAWLEEAHRRRAEWKAGKVDLLSSDEALKQMFPKA